MNTVMNYAADFASGGRARAFSFDGQPPMMQAPPGQAPVSPRYYPSNQPGFRPAYGPPGTYQQSAYPAYTTAPQVMQPAVGYAPQPQYYAPQPQVMNYGAPQAYQTTFNAPMGVVSGPPPMGAPGNSQICCPLPGPTEDPQGSQSQHAFQSNLPAGECEGLVRREVEYQTEWVAVPVQKPVVYETYQRVVEIPTQHLVNVQNLPSDVPPRQCDPYPQQGGYTAAPVAYNAGPAPVVGYGTSYGYQPQMNGAASPVAWNTPMAGGPMRTFSM